MSVAAALRALLRDRLTAAMDLVLTQVLQELDRALEDFEADSRTQEEPLRRGTVCSTGVQFPVPRVKQEPQKDSASDPDLQSPESPQVEWEPTDGGCSLSAAAQVEEFNEIQINFVTSLNTFTGPDTCKGLGSNFGVKLEKDTEKEAKCCDLQQSDSTGSCRGLGPGAPEPPRVKQEPTDRGRSLSGSVKAEELNDIQSSRVTLSGFTSPNARKDPPLSSSRGPNQHTDIDMEGKCSNQQQSDKVETNPQEQNVDAHSSPHVFTLKVPVIKLHPLYPQDNSEAKKIASKNRKTRKAKQKDTSVKYMCLCGKLFTKEALENHQTLCPSTVEPPSQPSHGRKRRHCEAFNVKGRGQERLGFYTGKSKATEYEGSGEMTEDFQIKTEREREQRDETLSCKEGNLRYFRETFLNKSKTNNPNEKRKVCVMDEARPHVDSQEGAPLDSGDMGEVSEAGAAFSCDVCGLGFSWLPRLYQHRKTHVVTGAYWCPDCGRTFRRLQDLRAHLCVQTGERPYSCAVCKEAFFLRIQLQMHMKQHKPARKKGPNQG